MKWTNKTYDIIKCIVSYWMLPLVTLLETLAKILEVPELHTAALIVAAIGTFLGQGMRISTNNYNATIASGGSND